MIKIMIVLASSLLLEAEAANITATGGGIVKPGSNLVLSYDVGQRWDRCFWYWYIHHAEYEYCSFDMAADASVKLHKCKPTTLGSIMEYSGKTSNECSVTIHNVTEAHNCTWAARLEDDLMPVTIEITVASPVSKVTTSVPQRLQANIPGKVECRIEGGRPAPQMIFQMGTTNSTPEILNNTQTQVPDVDGIYATHQEVWISPNITDHGKVVVCRAAILDGDAKLVFDWVAADEIKLNVTFPPQTIPNKTITGYANKNVTVMFEFQANPTPTDVKWIVVAPKKNPGEGSSRNSDSKTDGNTTVLTLNPGHDDDKYKVALLNSSGEVNFRAELTIMKLNEDDEKNEYHLEVVNMVGAKDYFFTLTVEGQEPNSTTTTTTIGPSTTSSKPEPEGGVNGFVVAFVIIIIIIGLSFCSYLIYRKRQRLNETAPLR